MFEPQRLRTVHGGAIATRVLLAIAALTAVLAGASGSAAADSSLNPPPLDWYTCKPTGSGTVCHGKMSFEWFGSVDRSCPQGFDILENGHKEETGARSYDRDGNLIRRVLHDIYPAGHPLNVLYNSETGKSVPYTADLTESDDFAVPGDVDSITARVTGNLYTSTAPGGGMLIHDVGVFTFGPDGSILEDRGPKMLFFGQTEKLCAALA